MLPRTSGLGSQKYHSIILQHMPVIYDPPSLYGVISIVKQFRMVEAPHSLCRPCLNVSASTGLPADCHCLLAIVGSRMLGKHPGVAPAHLFCHSARLAGLPELPRPPARQGRGAQL